jgi:hypothetical protein
MIEDGIRTGLLLLIRDEPGGCPDCWPGGWRGTIKPIDRDGWFASYGSFVEPYLRMADQSQIAQIDIGVELNSLAADPRWPELISSARSAYAGLIGFSNNWDVFQRGVLGPSSVDIQGLDAYFPAIVNNEISADGLAKVWIEWLNPTRKFVDLSTVVLAEVGIAAQVGAFVRPNCRGSETEPIDASVQVRWFIAAWKAMLRFEMRGIFYWMLDLNHPAGSSDPRTGVPMLFVGRGDKAIESCFGGARLAD